MNFSKATLLGSYHVPFQKNISGSLSGQVTLSSLSTIKQKEKTMKKRKSQFLLIALFAVVVLLLSACQVNFITDIKNDGSGLYTQEIGFQNDEASMAGLTEGDENFCASQNNELPPNTEIRQETRNDNETWCIYETAFTSLDDLKAIYGSTDTRVNDISSADGIFTYDIDLDLGTDSSSMPSGGVLTWTVIMPGKVNENNATQQDGNSLKWDLKVGEVNNIRAVSTTSGGLNLGGNTPWLIGGACMCMCLIALVVIGVVAFFVVRNNKKKVAASEPPVETPAA
jgi:hypothetical protein